MLNHNFYLSGVSRILLCYLQLMHSTRYDGHNAASHKNSNGAWWSFTTMQTLPQDKHTCWSLETFRSFRLLYHRSGKRLQIVCSPFVSVFGSLLFLISKELGRASALWSILRSVASSTTAANICKYSQMLAVLKRVKNSCRSFDRELAFMGGASSNSSGSVRIWRAGCPSSTSFWCMKLNPTSLFLDPHLQRSKLKGAY